MYLKFSIYLLLIRHLKDLHVVADIFHFSFKNVLSTEYSCECLFMSMKESTKSITELSTPHLPDKTDDDVVSIKFKHGSIFHEFPSRICEKFKNLKDMSMDKVFAGIINERSFEKCANLEKIMFVDNFVNNLDEKMFKANSKLRSIQIVSTGLETMSKNVFSTINQTLTDLNLQIFSNSFKFPPDFVNSLTNLRTLKLLITNLGELPQNFFENLENLEIIHLYSCNIHDLPRGIFKPLKNLRILDLRGNKLTAIYTDSFGLHPHLMVADFADNNIVSFDPTFYQFPSILFVNLQNSCDKIILGEDHFSSRVIRSHSNRCTKNYRPR